MKKLTVLMTVYNGEAYLKETMDSILTQTFPDFTYLILDNASTDSSRDIINSYRDPRIQLIALPQNIGQVAALNKGLNMVDTELVARIDADDISLPQRFEKQVAHMTAHPDTGICGTFAIAFKANETIKWTYPCDSAAIKIKLLFECALVHPSVMMRTEVLKRYDLNYDAELKHSYDWDLWHRAALHTEIVNLPEFLLKYRLHESSESQRTLDLQEEAARRLDDFALARLGLETHPLRALHRDLGFETLKLENRDIQFIQQIVQWFDTLERANRDQKIYHPETLHRFLKERLFIAITKNSKLGKPVRDIFFKEKISRYIPKLWTLKFLGKSLL